MTIQQPDALRLADQMLHYWDERGPDAEEVAAELRRLHSVNAQLLEACETLVGLPGTEDWLATLRLAVEQARAAIAAAKEMK